MNTHFLSSKLPTPDTSSPAIPNPSAPVPPTFTSSRQPPWGTHYGHGRTATLYAIRGCLSNRLPTEDILLQVLPNPSAPATPMCTSSRRTPLGTHFGHGHSAGHWMIWGFLSGR